MEIIEDSGDPPSPWRGYQRCLSDLPDCSHLLVIQDDALPVPNFVPALRRVAATNPETPVCLFMARLPADAARLARRAMKNGDRYITLPWRSFLPVVAVLWPRQKAVELMEWAAENPRLYRHHQPRSDDAMAGQWKMRTRQTVRVTVPSLVEHPDTVPSLIGRRAAWGEDKTRVALFLAEDGLEHDW